MGRISAQPTFFCRSKLSDFLSASWSLCSSLRCLCSSSALSTALSLSPCGSKAIPVVFRGEHVAITIKMARICTQKMQWEYKHGKVLYLYEVTLLCFVIQLFSKFFIVSCHVTQPSLQFLHSESKLFAFTLYWERYDAQYGSKSLKSIVN